MRVVWHWCCSYNVGLYFATVLLCLGTYLGGWAIAAGHIFLGIALFVALLTYRNYHSRFLVQSFRPSNIWLFIFLCTCLVCLVLAWEDYPNPLGDLKKLRHEFLPLMALLVLPIRNSLLKNRKTFINLGLIFLALSISLATISGLIGHSTGYNPLLRGPDPQPGRMGGVYSQVMTYAYGLQFSVLLLVSIGFVLLWRYPTCRPGNSIVNRTWVQVLLCLVLILGIVGLYFSYTRGAVLGLVIGCISLLFAAKSYKVLLMFGLIGMFCLLLLSYKNSYFIKNRGHSNYERLSQWRAATLVFLDHPITGIGYRQVEKRIDSYKQEYRLPKDRGRPNKRLRHLWFKGHSHNNYLEAFAGMGIVGGLSFIGFCVYWLRETWQSKWGRFLFFPAAVAFMVSGLFENTFFDGEVVTILMLLYVSSQIAIDVEEGKDSAI